MISFVVDGKPESGGSKIQGKTNFGRTFIRDTNKHVGPWKEAVRWTAKAAMRDQEPYTGPVALHVSFFVPRPKTARRDLPTVKPDLTKLLRPLEDALTGIVYKDDCQIIRSSQMKRYAEDGRPRAEVRVWPL